MEIMNNTETEKLRVAVNEALNPNDTVWAVLDAAKNDIIRFKTHGRAYAKTTGNPQIDELISEHLKLMESYFNNAKEILRVGLEMVGDGWKKEEYQKYLSAEFTPTWNK